jgi:hypothetical protein
MKTMWGKQIKNGTMIWGGGVAERSGGPQFRNFMNMQHSLSYIPLFGQA